MTSSNTKAAPDIAVFHPVDVTDQVLYTLHITQSFTRGLKDQSAFTAPSSDETYLEVYWQQVGNKTHVQRSTWKVEFADPEVTKSTILKTLAEDLLERLRENVIEGVYREFKGRLESVRCEGSLVVRFLHDDVTSGEEMVREESGVGDILLGVFSSVADASISGSLDYRERKQKADEDAFRDRPPHSTGPSINKDLSKTDGEVGDKRTTTTEIVKPQSSKHAIRDVDDILSGSEARVPAIENNFNAAETLLRNLGVCGSRSAQYGYSARAQRLIEKVAIALEPDPDIIKATGMDTVLCLDASSSIGEDSLKTIKRAVDDFLYAIEDVAMGDGLEENIAVVRMSRESCVLQQLTNDLNAAREAVESIRLGGRSPMMEALLLCIAAIKKKGGMVKVKEHCILPRIIFFTDGRCTSDAVPTGPDITTPDSNSKTEVIRVVTSLSTTEREISPVVWVPVGKPDRNFLDSVAKLGCGKVVEMDNMSSLTNHYRVQKHIADIHVLMVTSGNIDTLDTVTSALVGEQLDKDFHDTIVDEVKKKLDFMDVPDPDVRPSDFHNVHEVSGILPLGTRVVRGPDWMFDDQDLHGPGTVINHANDKGMLWVYWDLTGASCRYRCGYQGMRDVKETCIPRTLNRDEFIEIGVSVVRGKDWRGRDADGGKGGVGIVIRRSEDARVKVKWLATQIIEEYKYGCNGLLEVAVCQAVDTLHGDVKESTSINRDTGINPGTNDADINQGREEDSTSYTWMWKDSSGSWQQFQEEANAKLEKEYGKKHGTSCLVYMKEIGNARVTFSRMTGRADSVGTFEVQRKPSSSVWN